MWYNAIAGGEKVILTYKLKHNRDFSDELVKAKLVAQIALESPKWLSSKDVKHIGLKSAISCQILTKYHKRNRNVKKIRSVKLTLPSQSCKKLENEIYIPCLKLRIEFSKDVKKINQIEISNKYAYISCTVKENPKFKIKTHIGVDCNTVGNLCAIAVKETGKVYKLGKRALHVRRKYKAMRRRLQRKGKYKKVKNIGNKEQRICRDINHKISKKIVDLAVANKSVIRFENLKGIRKSKKNSKSLRGTLNSWSFYQLQKFVEYKAQQAGAEVIYIDPYMTSKCCSKCGHIGNRIKKNFECLNCGHFEHADVNAAFNIAFPSEALVQLSVDRDAGNWHLTCPNGATPDRVAG